MAMSSAGDGPIIAAGSGCVNSPLDNRRREEKRSVFRLYGLARHGGMHAEPAGEGGMRCAVPPYAFSSFTRWGRQSAVARNALSPLCHRKVTSQGQGTARRPSSGRGFLERNTHCRPPPGAAADRQYRASRLRRRAQGGRHPGRAARLGAAGDRRPAHPRLAGQAVVTIALNRVRRGFYMDSAALMRLAQAIGELPGVVQAALMIGSPSNKRLMEDAGLLAELGELAGANDLVIAVCAEDEAAGDAALAEAEALLDRPHASQAAPGEYRPRGLAAALAMLEGANLALVSVPGEFAAEEALKALRRDLHVMIFSDNVALDDEKAL